MAIAVKKLDPENELVQLLVTEAVKIAMESPLRDPILDVVEETTGDDLEATSEDEGSGREKNWFTKVVQGGAVFIVMFVVLYVTLRRLTSDEPDT